MQHAMPHECFPQDANEAPEMFSATTDRFAEPVEGDDADAALVRPLMAGTRLERAPLRSVRLWPPAKHHQ